MNRRVGTISERHFNRLVEAETSRMLSEIQVNETLDENEEEDSPDEIEMNETYQHDDVQQPNEIEMNDDDQGDDDGDSTDSGSYYGDTDDDESDDDRGNDNEGDEDVNDDADENPEPNHSDFRAKLAVFVNANRLTRKTTNELLSMLREEGYTDLPKTRETLLKCPRNKVVERVCHPGKYFHYGLEKSLKRSNFSFLQNERSVQIDVSIDGLSLSKSSKLKIWPILGAFVNKLDIPPFLIGAYVGCTDPASIDNFVCEFVEEMKTLLQEGALVTPRLIRKSISIRAFICDSPARSFLAGVQGHQANYGCNKCNQKCVRIDGKKTYLTVRGEPRTDQSFRNRDNLIHHKAPFKHQYSLIETLEVGMVSQIPNDPMHLLDEGVMNRILNSIIHGPCRSLHLRNGGREMMDAVQISMSPYVPSEFERKPRSIMNELPRFKGVELRFILNYSGCVVFKDFVGSPLYDHFMLLFTAVRFLASPATHIVKANSAQNLIDKFVEEYPNVYDPKEVVYNIHSLLHLSDDVKLYGPLYSYSAYKYENHMNEIKKLIRKPNKILAQINNRLEELNNINEKKHLGFVGLARPFNSDTFPGCTCSYKSFKYDAFILKNNLRDSVARLRDGTPIEVQAFAKCNGQDVLFAKKFTNLRNFFVNPVESMAELGIILCDKPADEVFKYNVNEIDYKYVRLPYRQFFVLIPMLHHLKN